MKLDRDSMKAASYSTVGLEFVLSILFGMAGGHWLDGRFGTEPTLTFVGLAFGLAAGFRSVYRAARRMKHDTENDAFRAADVGRPARFALTEGHRGARVRREAREGDPRRAGKPEPVAAARPDATRGTDGG